MPDNPSLAVIERVVGLTEGVVLFKIVVPLKLIP